MTDDEEREKIARAGPGVHFFIRDREMTMDEWERERCGS
jgi:hypothetical protein